MLLQIISKTIKSFYKIKVLIIVFDTLIVGLNIWLPYLFQLSLFTVEILRQT